MKTSNKIFSFGFFSLLLAGLVVLMVTKSNMVPNEQVTPKGDVMSETRTIEPFDKLSISSVRVEFHYGEPSVKIEAYENIMERIETKVEDGELYVGLKPGSYNNVTNHTTVHVTTNDLKAIKAKSGGNVQLLDTFEGDQLELHAHGGGSIELTLQSIDVRANASGGGRIKLEGNTTNLISDIDGGGRLEAFDLNVKNANMEVSGGGRARVNAEALTKAKVSGGGYLIYKGDPTISGLDISGGGQIKKQ